MTVSHSTLYRYRLPLKRPLILKNQPHHVREGLLVRFERGGDLHGWTEIAPLPGYSKETLAEAEAQTVRVLKVITGELHDWCWNNGAPKESSFPEPLYPSVYCGLSLILFSSFPPKPGLTKPLNALLFGTEEEILAKTTECIAQGYRAVKLKVGMRTLEEDVALVYRVHARLQGKAALRLDANRAWTFEQAMQFDKMVGAVPIEYVEEPLQDPAELPRLGDGWRLPIAFDETLAEVNWENLPHFPRLRALIIKPTLVGRNIHSVHLGPCLGPLAGLRQVISSSFESPVGLWLLAHLAASYSGIHLFRKYVAGLDTADWFKESTLNHPLPIINGAIDLSRTVTDSDIRMDALTEVFHV